MPYSVIVQPAAIEESDNAYLWYEKQLPGLGADFLEEIEIIYTKLEANPAIFSWVTPHFREAVVDRFPYVILYETVGNTVYIEAVFHTSRDPGEKFL